MALFSRLFPAIKSGMTGADATPQTLRGALGLRTVGMGLLTAAFLGAAAPADVMAGGPVNTTQNVLAGTPITATANTWTWVDFPDARCGNGSATGIGVNWNPSSTRLVIFFEGGGACSDYSSCWVTGTASNMSGYTKKDFDTGKPYARVPLFSRTDARNPYTDANYVYVPYCTGDVHSGTSVTPLGTGASAKDTYFVGYNNVSAYLSRLTATFPNLTRGLVSGWSAGGFGAAFNWEHIQKAFPAARIDDLDDSGPPFLPNGDKWSNWLTTWGIPVPADCPECAVDPQNFIDYYGARYDGKARFGLLSYTNDSVISSYYGMTRRQFHRGLYDLATTSLDPVGSFKYFFVDGSNHVMLSWDQLGPGGVKLSDWINQMVKDDPSWKSVYPPE